MVNSPVITRKENEPPASANKKMTCYYCSSLNCLRRDMLEDDSLWPNKCLQDLSRKLGLQASGSRDELVTRLRLWHVSKHDGKAFQVKEATVLPQFMSPFKRIEDEKRRSILRKRCRSESKFSTPPQSPEKETSPSIHQRTRLAETSPRRSYGRKKKKLVQFSPYNRVQLISPRRAGDNEHVQKLYESIREGKFEDSDDEEDEWSRTVSNDSGSPTCNSEDSGESVGN